MNSTMVNLLEYWITERNQVLANKKSGKPKPWSSDPIFQTYRFCNVDREDDTVTKWIHQHMRLPYRDDPYLWFNLALARFINLPECLNELGYFKEWKPERFLRVMDRREKLNLRRFNGAYIISGAGITPGKSKHSHLSDKVFTPLWKRRHEAPIDSYLCKSWDEFFSRTFGMGGFMRNQIIADMKYTDYLNYFATKDWDTYVSFGPGTRRGLNRVYGYPLDKSHKLDEWNLMVLRLREEILNRLPSFTIVLADLNNLANCLCEFDKYCRIKLEEGSRPKQLYPGKS